MLVPKDKERRHIMAYLFDTSLFIMGVPVYGVRRVCWIKRRLDNDKYEY